MMRVKGCFNEDCSACRNDMKFHESYMYCPRCGCELGYVCLRCHAQLSDDGESLCAEHLAQKEANVEKAKSYGKVALTEAEKVGNMALEKAKGFFAGKK